MTNEWIAHAIEQLPERPETMLLAGGVFANVRLNQLVAEQHGASEVLIHQNMGDGGLATGAAYLAQAERAPTIRPLDHPTVYFGPSYRSSRCGRARRSRGPVHRARRSRC